MVAPQQVDRSLQSRRLPGLFLAGQLVGTSGYEEAAALGFVAGVNAVLFYVTGLGRQVEALAPGEDTPRGAKIIAGVSLVLWIGVMYFGRMLPWEDALYMVFENPEDWG